MKDRDKKQNLVSFKHYYETNVSSLILFARRFISSDMVEDIVHDVFLEVWNLMENEEDLPARSFLFVVVRNRCLNILKREQVKENYIHTVMIDSQLLELDYYDSCEKLIVQNDELQKIYDEIELLPEKCRIIFKMAYFEEKKNAEIALLLNLSIRTVEHQLYLGLRVLREKLTAKEKKQLFLLLLL